MIDFTGGQKVTSVVAAAVAPSTGRSKPSNVQANHPFDVISGDILMGSLETGGLGM